MTKITFKYDSKEENISISSPSDNFKLKDHLNLFFKFLITIGFDFKQIYKSFIDFSFSNESIKNEIIEHAGIVLTTNFEEKVEERVKELREKDIEWSQVNDTLELIEQMGNEIIQLKAKISRFENPDFPSYTQEELEAMALKEVSEDNF